MAELPFCGVVRHHGCPSHPALNFSCERDLNEDRTLSVRRRFSFLCEVYIYEKVDVTVPMRSSQGYFCFTQICVPYDMSLLLVVANKHE